jgi:hypothetical protein
LAPATIFQPPDLILFGFVVVRCEARDCWHVSRFTEKYAADAPALQVGEEAAPLFPFWERCPGILQ